MKEETFIKITTRFRQVLKASMTYPHLPEVMDVIVDERPPLRGVNIADKLGMHPTMVSRYVKVIKKFAYPKIRYLPSMIGLGIIVALIDNKLLGNLPHPHWVYSTTMTWKGLLVSYRYPLIVGPDFIVRDLRKAAKWIEVFPYSFDSRAKIGRFINVNRELYNAVEALNITLELPPERVCFTYRYKPKDLFDLFLLAILEADARLNYMGIARRLKKLLNVRFPYRKVKVHMYHLLKETILTGFAFRAVLEAPICTAILMQFGSDDDLSSFVRSIVNYPYMTRVTVNRESGRAFLLLFISMRNVPPVIDILREYYSAEILDFIQFSIENRLATYTLPFRNYDPLARAWAMNPVDIDEWLRKKGYSVISAVESG